MTYWRSIEYQLPVKEGRYLVYAPSEDGNKPFYAVAFWDSNLKEWAGIHRIWAKSITNWMPLPLPPIVGNADTVKLVA